MLASDSTYVADGMPRFKVPDRRVPLTFKVPGSLKSDLKAIERLWKALAKAADADPDDIDMTYVCNRLLETGKDDAWAEVLEDLGFQKLPETDAEWKRFEDAIKARQKRDEKK